ncbi:transcription activator BRG1 [Dendroctonus ponderosae]|uniref:Golgi integral membrane protein 4 n=1 Tax=Dendroctonus ponderosae TaxID=77166 RepID=U4URT1_DENPD|nr:transcription activator BRG1 [Dendroctonus ponderosae]ERL95233.1 hypothetical protein D910_12500 [Dendroctonus ponderosae]KAH1024157.1 hypothetical protein HUJ05_003694 [Dendroctonus ponderosae]KAH1024158.1 hypothetical protein HUJ05_003694 [Dendroctonus ponderosae]
MTASRAIRGTKAKVILYIVLFFTFAGLISMFNDIISKLDEAKNSNVMCHQQQENLSTQLHVISEYKEKLEENLKIDQAELQENKGIWETKVKEERDRAQKLIGDAQMKYNSMLQHFKLLQTEFDDFKELSSGSQKKQLEEINSLQSKLKKVEEELKKVSESKEEIKTQLIKLELENGELKTVNRLNHVNESIKFYLDEHNAMYQKYTALKKKCGNYSEENPATLPNADLANKPSEKAVLNLPGLKMAENPSSSTKAVPKVSPSEGALNGARPLLVPNVTPESAKKKGNLKPPQGVVEPPDRENQNEQPQVQFEKKDLKDDIEKDNVAQEVFDGPQNNIEGGLAFDDGLMKPALNLGQKKDDKKHDDQEYKDIQREEEGDDDMDDYDNHQGRAEDIAVRN